MRSLFLKIFLWFGVAMVLVNIASFTTGILTERRFQPPRNHPASPMMAVFAETAAEVYERDGQPALRSYLDRVEQTATIGAVLYNTNGEELSGRTPPEKAKELAASASSTSPIVFDPPEAFPPPEGGPPPRVHAIAQWVTTSKGVNYILVGKLPARGFPGPPPRLGEPGSLGFGTRVLGRTLLPLLFVGGLFCYLLARYLTKPIVNLRGTTHQLADGNLSARADESLLRRRDEIGYLGRDFNLMADHIESLVAAHRRLLADISHELRSPLARQVVALGLAKRKGNDEVQPSLNRIAREAERMNEMIGQLLDLSRLENGTDGLPIARVDLDALVNEVAEDADYEARDRNRKVRVVRTTHCTTEGVADLLRSGIENVVRNAARHTLEGTEVEIALTCDSAELRNATITVRDHGPGVPQKVLSEIFQPFYRVDDARDRKSGGTGLGLAIAARAVRLHGGTVTAENVTDGGLEVKITIPLRKHPSFQSNGDRSASQLHAV